MKTLLWLDDIRDPLKDNWLVFSPIEQPFELVWVKSFKEFVDWIGANGLPTAICFDHDLGLEYHYTELDPEEENGYELRYDDYKVELSGYHAAKWLVEYCMDNDEDLPLYNIQSANTVGKDNIDGLLKSFIKFKNK
jgi:hypothetical protein